MKPKSKFLSASIGLSLLFGTSFMALGQISTVLSGGSMAYNAYPTVGPLPPTYTPAEAVKNFYLNVNGSPYLYDGWLTAQVVTETGNRYSVKAKYNLYTGLIESKVDDSDALKTVCDAKSVVLYTSETDRLLLEKGFPAVNGYNRNTLYQVLATGKIKLLKKAYKKLQVQEQYATNIPIRQFNDRVDYFVYINHKMIKVKRDAEAVVKVLPDNQQEVLAYINAKNLRLKEDEDLKQVFEYYNSL